MFEAMLYEHEDGRQAVSFIVPAPFSHNDPKWHRVGPVRVYGAVAPLPSVEVEQALRAVHLSHKLGPSYDWEDLHLAFETGAAVAASPPGASPVAPAPQAQAVSQAAQDVLAERQRQISVEGWTAEHDDTHDKGEMAVAAAIYSLHRQVDPLLWVTSGDRYNANARFLVSVEGWVKPNTPRRSLVKAGALILAEIERLDRVSAAQKEPT